MPPRSLSVHVHHFGLPALQAAIALVHFQQIGGEQGGLVAAGAGADFDDGRGIVGGIFGQQLDFQVMVECLQPRPQVGALLLRHAAHVGIAGGIGDHRLGFRQLNLRGAIGLRRLDHRRQLGMLAAELDKGFARRAATPSRPRGRRNGPAGGQVWRRGSLRISVQVNTKPGQHRQKVRLGHARVHAMTSLLRGFERLFSCRCAALASISAAFFSHSSTTCSTRSSLPSL